MLAPPPPVLLARATAATRWVLQPRCAAAAAAARRGLATAAPTPPKGAPGEAVQSTGSGSPGSAGAAGEGSSRSSNGSQGFPLKVPLSPLMDHAVYTADEVRRVKVSHRAAGRVADWAAYGTVRTMRFGFDLFSGYLFAKQPTAPMLLSRMVFLETVAGVPGLVAGMTRHLKSLAMMRRDYGWINTLLEEAENERMHLLTFLEVRRPGPVMRAGVLAAQAVFWPVYFAAYFAAPAFCHRFVGYLEEEAVKTYTHAIAQVEAGALPEWQVLPAPELAAVYWQLPRGATFVDVLYAVRADEANHRDTNHVLADTPQQGVVNPLAGKRYCGDHHE